MEEKFLANHPIPITIEETTKILEQMKSCICKIHLKNGEGSGTGFFCNISYKNDYKLPVLMTNNHVINDEYLKNNNEINISLNDEKIQINILINNNRKIYTNEKYDITIIEIIETDKINNYLEIDPDIFESNQNVFESQTIYILQYPNYPKRDKASVSYGILKAFNDYNFNHLCSTHRGSSGSPILNLLSNKIIGIHHRASSKNNFNIGTYIREPIEDFINSYNNNEIRIKVKVNEEDINNEIYFLNNYEDYGKDFQPLDELNKSNTELFINKIKYEYNNYFIPKETGIYSIELKLKNNIKDCSCLFFRCNNIVDIDLSSFDSKEVTNMKYMFAKCENLSNINLSHFNTKNVTCMRGMFSSCKNLVNIDVSYFNTEKVTNMFGMFRGCEKLKDLNLSNFNTKNINNMLYLFDECMNLTKLDLSSFNNINKSKKMKDIFNYKKDPLEILSSPSFKALMQNKNIANLVFNDIESGTDMSPLIFKCKKLKEIKLKQNFYKEIKEDIEQLEKDNNSKILLNFID